ncbi:hypothetical protein [Microscilla marina]|uniref:ADP-ribosylation/crystallin J1 n=1 Tax=Microscilla marina ATCC 23134 TaxID=313606 RepID=A1ZRC0_MICM2|nr:hypothetical protein [Microscilla marina]EAY27010.1 conserved hypothetical protein [Microscilla marina ATCC 23134]
MKLYRPVGLKELELILAANAKAYPPRLQWQPIFYPVLNFEYARQIATRWNLDDELSGYAGFVTAFDINDAYIAQFEVQNVGAHLHNELWIPAESLAEFNTHIHGYIQVLAAYYGEKYTGKIQQTSVMAGFNAFEQLNYIAQLPKNDQAIVDVIKTDAVAIQVNFAYWQQTKQHPKTLACLQNVWQAMFPERALGVHQK